MGRKLKIPYFYDSFQEKLQIIFSATKQHAKNLAFFVTLFKLFQLVQKKIKGKASPSDSFISGLLGGYLVFGEDNGVNQQVFVNLRNDPRLFCIYCQELLSGLPN